MRRLLFLLAFFAHPVLAQYEPSPPDQAASHSYAAACSSKMRRQFDFRVDPWAVTQADQPAGNSRIEERLGGCELSEHGTTLFDGLCTRSVS